MPDLIAPKAVDVYAVKENAGEVWLATFCDRFLADQWTLWLMEAPHDPKTHLEIREL